MAQQAWDIHANSGGRFVLGLGSQVKGHNERRFGIAWTAPAPRMRDYVQALRAVWTLWETRGRLNFDSPHYKLTLMTPDFSPEPTGLPMVPVTVAAVGEAMLRVAGQVGDGVRLHPLCSRAYLEQVCMPQMMEGMRRSGRSRLNFDVHGGGFVCTGPDDATVAAEMEKARRRIGFYGSTRTYLPILALHGLEDLGVETASHVGGRPVGSDGRPKSPTTRSASSPPAARTKRWRRRSSQRFGGVADSVDIHFPPALRPGWQRNWCRIFAVSRTHSPASTRTGRETIMATPMFRFDPVELPPEAIALRVRSARVHQGAEAGLWASASEFNREFSRAMGTRGWIGMTWPKQYGGHERPAFERYVMIEEMLAAGAPLSAHYTGDRQSGPNILRFGTEEQKQFFCPQIAAGEC